MFTQGKNILFASLGDSINPLTINVANKTNLFDTFTILITAADTNTYSDIVQAFSNHGLSKMVFCFWVEKHLRHFLGPILCLKKNKMNKNCDYHFEYYETKSSSTQSGTHNKNFFFPSEQNQKNSRLVSKEDPPVPDQDPIRIFR